MVIGAATFGTVEAIHRVASWLAAPGTFITLALHNLVEAWWWAMSPIAFGNGISYRLVTVWLVWLVRRLSEPDPWN